MTDTEFDLVFSYCRKPILIMGAGNILYGDDGFGPAVIEELEKREDIPDEIHLLDIGSSARNILFNILLSEKIPETIILIDSVNKGRGPGEVFEIDIDELPVEKSDDFQFHLVPTSNMMKDLRDERGVNLVIIACEAVHIPEVDMFEGLSDELKAAVPVAADLAIKRAREALGGLK
jgi:coenzyme F420 hydrogenase subunit delta